MKFCHSALPSEEWDFRRLPDGESLACCLYEYAREFARASNEVQRALTHEAICDSAPKGSALRAESFDAYSAVADLLQTPRGLPYWRADMVAVPWRKLSVEERERAVKRLRPFKVESAIKPGDEIPGLAVRTIWNPSKRDGGGITITHTFPAEIVINEGAQFADFVASRTAESLVCGNPTNGLEFGFFAVDWNNTKEQLSNALLDWLDEELAKRKGRKAAYSKRGKEKATTPDGWLRALGATRLLRCRMTLQQALDYSAKSGGHPLFKRIADWSKARRKTFPQVMRMLFGAKAVWEN